MTRLIAGLLPIVLWSGCIAVGDPQSVGTDQCSAEDRTLLDAVDTLYLQRNRTYSLLVHSHKAGWGRLTLLPCEPMAVLASAPKDNRTSPPGAFTFAYMFPSNETPAKGYSPVKEWAFGAAVDGCGLQTSPRTGPSVGFGFAPAADRWTLVVAGSATSRRIHILTGDPRGDGLVERRRQWDLEPHAGLVVKPLGPPATSSFFETPPRPGWTWNVPVEPDSPSIVNVGWWLKRSETPAAGEFTDRVAIEAGEHGTQRTRTGTFACGPGRASTSWDFVGVPTPDDGGKVTIKREYTERPGWGTTATFGMELVVVPLDPPPLVAVASAK